VSPAKEINFFLFHLRPQSWNGGTYLVFKPVSRDSKRSESIATFPPFGPIEGHKWFFQISSQWESQMNQFVFISFGKIQFLPPCIWDLPFMSYLVPPLTKNGKTLGVRSFYTNRYGSDQWAAPPPQRVANQGVAWTAVMECHLFVLQLSHSRLLISFGKSGFKPYTLFKISWSWLLALLIKEKEFNFSPCDQLMLYVIL
jgi:hypothetical protein